MRILEAILIIIFKTFIYDFSKVANVNTAHVLQSNNQPQIYSMNKINKSLSAQIMFEICFTVTHENRAIRHCLLSRFFTGAKWLAKRFSFFCFVLITPIIRDDFVIVEWKKMIFIIMWKINFLFWKNKHIEVFAIISNSVIFFRLESFKPQKKIIKLFFSLNTYKIVKLIIH